MKEKLQRYNPANYDGVTIEISSTVREPGTARVTFTDDEQDIHDSSSIEEADDMYDVESLEGLEKAREYVRELAAELAEWQASPGEISPDADTVSQHIRTQLANCVDLIRYQNEALATDAGNGELQQRAEKITEAINTLSRDYENFSTVLEDESGFLLRELADDIRSRSVVPEERKTGWWDKEGQTTAEVAGADGDLRQVWGDQDGPIGFEAPVAEDNEDKERTGWWNKDFKEAQGFKDADLSGELTQRGEIASGEVEWPEFPAVQRRSVRLPNGKAIIFPTERTAEPTPEEPVTEDRLFSDTIKDLQSSTSLSRSAQLENFQVKAPFDTTVPPEYVEYGEARKEWLDAKKVHEEMDAAYLAAADAYYTNWAKEVEEKGFIERNSIKLRAKFGFKPELPEDVVALRRSAFEASEEYGKRARAMTEMRELAGKKSRSEVSPEVLDRYNRRFAHEILLNTFGSQIESQKKAVESLGLKPGKITSYLIKNKEVIKFAGAATIGAVTGAIIPAGVWWLRSAVGGAAGAGAAKFVDSKLGARIDSWREKEYEAEILGLAEKLNNTSLTAKELAVHHARLEKLMSEVDEKTRNKLIATLATAGLAGALVGGGAGYAAEEAIGLGADALAPDATDAGGAKPSQISSSISETAETGVTKVAEDVQPGDTPEVVGYAAEKGDNFWDIMEGQTEAGKLDYLETVDEAHRQAVIDLVRDKIDSDAALSSELGFGKNADSLQVGAQIDTEKLNQLAEEIVKEKGWAQAEVPAGSDAETAIPEDSTPAETPTASAEPASNLSEATASDVRTSAKEVPSKVSYDDIRQYEKSYGGHAKFMTDFEKQFVDKIQGYKTRPLFNFFGPNKASVYTIFGMQQMSDFEKLESYDAATQAKELSEYNIEMKEYLTWRDTIAQWKKDGLVIKPNDTFADVAQTAFIRSLETPKT